MLRVMARAIGLWKREGSGCVSLVPMVALGPTSAQGKPVDLNNP